MRQRYWLNWALLAILAGIIGLCFAIGGRDYRLPNYRFMPETQMAESPAYDSFSPNPNFGDGLTLRSPPAGSVPRGQMPIHYQATLQDAQRAGEELKNPFLASDALRLERGQFVFDNFCSVCHGPLGQGNGPVTQKGFPPPASLMAERATQMKDGQMFHVLTYGQANMPSFATQLSQNDRWSTVLYVRLLQGSDHPSAPQTRLQQVAVRFHDNCAACHGEDGTGNNIRKVIPLIPDFTSLAWQMSQTEMAIVNQIEFGSHPLMPAFRNKLPSDDILRLAVYVRSFAAHSQRTAQSATQPIAAAASHLTASNVYGTYCFACHDTNGKGNPSMRPSMPELPDFTAGVWQKSRTDADLSHSILQGKGKFMLPMKDKIGTVDVSQMVKLIRGFDGGKQVIALEAPKAAGPVILDVAQNPAVSPTVLGPTAIGPAPNIGPSIRPEDSAERIRVGATIFQQYCIVCHGPDGAGSVIRQAMPQIPNFTFPAFQLNRTDRQLKNSILDGKGTLMPANRGRVTPDQADSLIAYVRAFGPKGLAIPTGPVSDTDFDKSFQRLQDQWNELQRQLQKAKEPPPPQPKKGG